MSPRFMFTIFFYLLSASIIFGQTTTHPKKTTPAPAAKIQKPDQKKSSTPAKITDKSKAKSSPENQSIKRTAEKFINAYNDLNWQAMSAYFAENATMFTPYPESAGRINGRDKIVAWFKSQFISWESKKDGSSRLNIKPQDLKIQAMKDLAIVTFLISGEKRVGRRTIIFQKQKDQWMIVHLHASNLVVEK